MFYQKKPDNNILQGTVLPSGGGSIILNAQEIGKHNSQSDCWMIIAGKVYNFTNYLELHPGGAVSMLPYCGRDGSEAFATKDKKNLKPHSDYAKSLFADYYLGDLNQKINQSQNPLQSQLPTPSLNASNFVSTPIRVPNAPPASINSNIILNAQEIVKHNSTGNCWLIINSKVYNVTSYLSAHPGGVGAIAPYCGREATQVFAGLPHSSNANSLLNGYFIGNLNQTVTVQPVQQNPQSTAQISPSPTNGRDEEDD